MQNQAKKLDMQKLLAPLALVILYIVFSIFGTNFLSLDMVKNILESSYYIGFMAFGVTFIIDVLLVWLLYKSKVFTAAKLWPPMNRAKKSDDDRS